jgi:hypothetical protein
MYFDILCMFKGINLQGTKFMYPIAKNLISSKNVFLDDTYSK